VTFERNGSVSILRHGKTGSSRHGPPRRVDTPGVSASTMSTPGDAAVLALAQRRILRVLAAAQVLGGAGFFIGFAVVPVLAREVTGSASLAGLPSAAAVAASALAAVPLSRLMTRAGRRPGLALGHAIAVVGAGLVVLATVSRSLPVLMVGTALFGVGNTSNLLARYAATDVSLEHQRGRATSVVLFATALGAVAAPNLVPSTGKLAGAIELPALAGPFLFAFFASGLAALLLLILLRPDPLEVAGLLTVPTPRDRRHSSSPRPPILHALRDRRVAIGATAMIAANLVMTVLMTMAPVHLVEHGHSLAIVGVVLSVHVAGMFLPSPLSGWLCDRWGRIPVIAAGAVALLCAAAVGATADADASAPVGVALLLLGLGWNLAIVGGGTLLTDALAVAERPRVQGTADLAMGMAGALGGLASGAVLAAGGFLLLSVLAAGVVLPLLLVLLRTRVSAVAARL
jgi:MFS family permease